MTNIDQLNKALDNVDLLYSDLVSAANVILDPYIKDVNVLVDYVNKNIEHMSNEDLRLYMMKLSLKGFTFSEVKEKSALKAECAETLRKEAYAKNFNAAEGSVAFRENTAIINSSYEMLSQNIYDLVASLFKVKCDEIHRVVDTMKTVIMSRMQEARLSQSTVDQAFDN